ncbi:hypothetical protein SZN_04431 [Streptomyces zinciresistens K42]|uniref:Uncharacterized protein n=1 Tax=Streptomyces zinciresistens K42 TaxID=700597 RepID=G2G5Y0_9ACTN|nr:hypothetical protein [Streptomyces zinciresistens]EGX61069.1 hypothetical protein SZN_04431 [Streptomyces zinciresistens K42]
MGEGEGVALGDEVGRAEAPSELSAPGVDEAAADSDEDEQPLVSSAVAENSARLPRASLRRRRRADGAVSPRGW